MAIGRCFKTTFGVLTVVAVLFGGGAEIPAHLALAKAMIAQVSPASNAYVHRPLVWSLNGASSTFQGDCSGLVVLTFRECYGIHADQWKTITGVPRPLAAHFHDAVAVGKPFAPVAKVEELRAGDLFFIKYTTRPESGDTGHVVLVASNYQTAWKLSGGMYGIPVIDSSKSPHGMGDTRNRGPKDSSDHDGLGEGIFGVKTGPSGAVIAHAWTPRSTNVRPVTTHPLVMARWVGLSNAVPGPRP